MVSPSSFNENERLKIEDWIVSVNDFSLLKVKSRKKVQARKNHLSTCCKMAMSKFARENEDSDHEVQW